MFVLYASEILTKLYDPKFMKSYGPNFMKFRAFWQKKKKKKKVVITTFDKDAILEEVYVAETIVWY